MAIGKGYKPGGCITQWVRRGGDEYTNGDKTAEGEFTYENSSTH